MKKECNHVWAMYSWITEDIPSERICVSCSKKQSINYLGGSMWKWVDS